MVEFLNVPATSKHSATIILVHGLGDSGYGLQPLAKQLQAAGLQHCKFILPHAPTRAITANSGRRMPAWFDVRSFTPPGADDEAQMLESLASLEEIFTNQVESGIEPHRVIIGGFSQGGTMALLMGMISQCRVHGVVVLSGRLPLKNADGGYSRLKELASPHAASVPIFWGHGKADPLLTYNLAVTSVDYLTSVIGVPTSTTKDEFQGLTFKSYDGMGHSTCPQEISDLSAWLQNALPR
ncbi:Phospholipase/carboxylesterase/thioesterase [Mycena amicta]|nr:Phospholipase/carboxylesterase/thioesterase [Mycena amicta]